MYVDRLDTVIKCKLFHGIDRDDLNSMLKCLIPTIKSYDKNELITVSGEEFSGLGIMLSGEAVITKENAAGDRVIIAKIAFGEMFGEMAAFSGGGIWPATVMAKTKCQVMILPPKKIVSSCEKACESHRQLIINMLNIISNKALMLNKKLEYLSIKNIRGKLSTFLLEQYNKIGKHTFMLPLKRNELADFLNVSRPALSREMCKLRDNGIIDFHRSSVKIKDLEALKAMI
jgi:CRP-like cAMP-binding protein